MAFKKGILTESDIRVIDSYSKKNISDAIQEPDRAKNAAPQKAMEKNSPQNR